MAGGANDDQAIQHLEKKWCHTCSKENEKTVKGLHGKMS